MTRKIAKIALLAMTLLSVLFAGGGPSSAHATNTTYTWTDYPGGSHTVNGWSRYGPYPETASVSSGITGNYVFLQDTGANSVAGSIYVQSESGPCIFDCGSSGATQMTFTDYGVYNAPPTMITSNGNAGFLVPSTGQSSLVVSGDLNANGYLQTDISCNTWVGGCSTGYDVANATMTWTLYVYQYSGSTTWPGTPVYSGDVYSLAISCAPSSGDGAPPYWSNQGIICNNNGTYTVCAASQNCTSKTLVQAISGTSFNVGPINLVSGSWAYAKLVARTWVSTAKVDAANVNAYGCLWYYHDSLQNRDICQKSTSQGAPSPTNCSPLFDPGPSIHNGYCFYVEVQDITYNLTVPSSGFNISSPLSSVSVNNCQTVQVPVSINGEPNFAGTVALSDSNTATYLSTNFSPSSLALSSSSESGSSTMTLTASCSAPDSSSGYIQLSDTITARLSGQSQQHSIPLTIYVCYASIYCGVGFNTNPSKVSVTAGGHAQTSVGVYSLGHFAGTVTIQPTVSPGDPGATVAEWNTWGSGVTQTSVTLTPGQIVYMPLYITGGVAGNSVVYIPCYGSGTGNCAQVAVATADFGISASPSSVSLQQGYNAVTQITVTSLNGFSGSVTLTATPSVNVCGFSAYFPGNPYGCNGQGSTTVSVSSGGSVSVQLNIGVCLSTPPGSYSVTVTGTDSLGSSNATTIQVQVLSGGPGCDSGSVAAGTLITL